MLAKIVSGGKRVVQSKPMVEGLRHLIGGKNFAACAPGANGETCGEEQHRPVPVENLCSGQQQQECAAESNREREGGFLNEQVAHLPPPAAADQIAKGASLAHYINYPRKPRFQA